MAASIVTIAFVGGPDEPWIVKRGRKVIGTHFTFEAAAVTMKRELDRIGVRFVESAPAPEPEPEQRLIQVSFPRKKGPSDPYTYALPPGMNVEVGDTVYVPVPFGSEDKPATVVQIGSDYEGWAEEIWQPSEDDPRFNPELARRLAR